MKPLIIALAAAGLLAACGISPENQPISVPASDQGKKFLDLWLDQAGGDVPAQSPAPTYWTDLMLPPTTVPHGKAEVTGTVLVPNAINHG